MPSATMLSPSSIVGRHEELTLLEDVVESVAGGLGGSLVLLGVPGVGKSRLLMHLDDTPRLCITRLSGVDSELQLGFAAAHRLLRPFFGHLRDLPAPQRNALLVTFGQHETASPPTPFLVDIAVLNLLATAARETPQLIVIDDAQWIDRESIALFAFVARRVLADGLGLVFAGREGYPSLSALEGLPTHRMGGLDAADSATLLAGVGGVSVSPFVAGGIAAETDGNPLALIEVARLLTADELGGHCPLPERLPTGRELNAHFLGQVDALPSSTRALLVLISTMSNDDGATLWAAAAVLGLHRDHAYPALQADVLQVGEPPAFRHPLIRAAVYNTADPETRRACHVALAAVAESTRQVDLAAWHRAAAAEAPDERAAAGLERCADRAERRGGLAAQARFLAKAAELSGSDRDRGLRLFGAAKAYLAAGNGVLAGGMLDRAAESLDREPFEVDILRMRASVAALSSRYADAPALLLDAVARAEPTDHGLIRGLLFDALQASLIAAGHTVGATSAGIGRLALAHPLPARAEVSESDLLLDAFATRVAVGYEESVPLLDLAARSLYARDQEASVALPSVMLGLLATDDLWNDRERVDLLDRAAAIQRAHGALGALRMTLACRSVSHAWAGKMALARQTYSEAAQLSALMNAPEQPVPGALFEIRAMQGDEMYCRPAAETSWRWAEQNGSGLAQNVMSSALCTLEIGLGNYAQAAELAVAVMERDSPGFANRILPEVVEACMRTGRRRTADEALDRLRGRALASGTPWALGILARSSALCATDDRADELYTEAIRLLEHTTMVLELGRAHLLYGEWLRRQKRRKAATEHLRTALQIFTAMEAGAFARRSRHELLATGYPVREGERRFGSSLTPQEHHVARLAASGSTNHEIAGHLFLTTSTIEYHLNKVFHKLGVTSRRHLARALADLEGVTDLEGVMDLDARE